MPDRLREAGFDVQTRNHAAAILAAGFPGATAEGVGALREGSPPGDGTSHPIAPMRGRWPPVVPIGLPPPAVSGYAAASDGLQPWVVQVGR